MKLIKTLAVAAVLTVAAQAHAFTEVETAGLCAGNYNKIKVAAAAAGNTSLATVTVAAQNKLYNKYKDQPVFFEFAAKAFNNKMEWQARADLAQNCSKAGF